MCLKHSTKNIPLYISGHEKCAGQILLTLTTFVQDIATFVYLDKFITKVYLTIHLMILSRVEYRNVNSPSRVLST